MISAKRLQRNIEIMCLKVHARTVGPVSPDGDPRKHAEGHCSAPGAACSPLRADYRVDLPWLLQVLIIGHPTVS